MTVSGLFFISFIGAVVGGALIFRNELNCYSEALIFLSTLVFLVLNGTALRVTFTTCGELSETLKTNNDINQIVKGFSGGRFSFKIMSKVVLLTHSLPILVMVVG